VASIASVYVEILPVTGKIADGIAKALLGVDDDVRQASRRWRRDIEKELGEPTAVDDDEIRAAMIAAGG